MLTFIIVAFNGSQLINLKTIYFKNIAIAENMRSIEFRIVIRDRYWNP